MKEMLPGLGDTQARRAWDKVFSRDVLGSVFIGSASGKFVENVIALLVISIIGPDAPPFWETVGYVAAWGTAIPVGVAVFVYWHRIQSAAEEAAEKAKDATDD